MRQQGGRRNLLDLLQNERSPAPSNRARHNPKIREDTPLLHGCEDTTLDPSSRATDCRAGDLRKKARSPLPSWRAKRGHLVLSDSTARFPRRFAPRNDGFGSVSLGAKRGELMPVRSSCLFFVLSWLFRVFVFHYHSLHPTNVPPVIASHGPSGR